MTLRRAREGDIGDIVELVGSYQGEVRPDLALHRGTVAARVRYLIGQPDGCALVVDCGGVCGALLGQVAPSMWWPDASAEILLWWLDPEHRGARWAAALIAAFEAWAVDAGAGRIGATYTGKSARAFFGRRGYRLADTRMMKELG